MSPLKDIIYFCLFFFMIFLMSFTMNESVQKAHSITIKGVSNSISCVNRSFFFLLLLFQWCFVAFVKTRVIFFCWLVFAFAREKAHLRKRAYSHFISSRFSSPTLSSPHRRMVSFLLPFSFALWLFHRYCYLVNKPI